MGNENFTVAFFATGQISRFDFYSQKKSLAKKAEILEKKRKFVARYEVRI